VFGLGILLLLPSVWSETSVTGMDEYWLSFRTPMEMNQRGDWLTPWLNGEPRLRKPPLLYWAILLNYKIFGTNLLSARIWGVLSGAGLATCACLFSRQLFRNDGLLAGLLALATIGVAVEGRRAMLDLPAALFSTLAVLCFVKWLGDEASSANKLRVPNRSLDSLKDTGPGAGVLLAPTATSAPVRIESMWGLSQGRRPVSLLVLCGVLLGLSFLTKGPVGMLFFSAGVAASLIALRPGNILRANWAQLVLAIVALLAVCLPWPLAMQHLWSERFGRILGEELAARNFGQWTPGSPLSAWSGALGLVLPWTPLMIAAIYSSWRRKDLPDRRDTLFLIFWFLLSAAPFFFMRSFERYMLALLPAQVALCAYWLETGPARTRQIVLQGCVLVLVMVAVAICAFAGWFKLAGAQVILTILMASSAVLLVFRRAHPQWVCFFSALLFTLALGGIYPHLGINALPKSFSIDLSRYPVSVFNPPQPALLSMRLGRSIQALDKAHWTDRPASRPPEIVFVESPQQQEFLELVAQHHLQAEEKGRFQAFYSRRAWIRFPRPGATWEDWKEAIRARSLEGLKSQFLYYLVTSKD
jgi:4-amino-4-deoxy-L-arabinose transferase-like glycosyltransferase